MTALFSHSIYFFLARLFFILIAFQEVCYSQSTIEPPPSVPGKQIYMCPTEGQVQTALNSAGFLPTVEASTEPAPTRLAQDLAVSYIGQQNNQINLGASQNQANLNFPAPIRLLSQQGITQISFSFIKIAVPPDTFEIYYTGSNLRTFFGGAGQQYTCEYNQGSIVLRAEQPANVCWFESTVQQNQLMDTHLAYVSCTAAAMSIPNCSIECFPAQAYTDALTLVEAEAAQNPSGNSTLWFPDVLGS